MLALLDDEVALEAPGNLLAGRETKTNVIVLDLFCLALHLLEFHKRNKQKLLSFRTDSFASVNDLNIKDKL